MRWTPIYEYQLDAAGVAGARLSLGLPQRVWRTSMDAVGGHKVAASGVPESATLRRDHYLLQRLRLREGEWVALQALVAHAQDTAEAVRVRMGPSDPGTLAYLHAPVHGARFAPEPGQHPGVLEVEVEWRRADGQPWDMPFYTPR